MNASHGFPVKKVFLYTLIASVGLGAVIGIIAILGGHFAWLQIKILLTSATIVGASICGLACGAYLAGNRGQVLPLAGLALSLVAAGLIIAGLWLEVSAETYWKLAAGVSIFAVACAHLALLSMARLAAWFRWSLVAAYLAIFGVAALLVLLILMEFDFPMFQLLAAGAVFDTAITILIPIFHRLSKPQVAAGNASPDLAVPADLDAEIATLRARLLELERLKQQGH